ncbi:DUF563 domain-containing protein [Marinoscillum sp. MHG1-6]|uniref:glycosyltransferase family 61 protein n=1 Tax=Marinoscillum sp. MHG1-6 TaxID=2959627 RepID=UPI002157FB86|nr:glycosyltransferase family 61 protein [Marinoscillum sp. MHG1-6]
MRVEHYEQVDGNFIQEFYPGVKACSNKLENFHYSLFESYIYSLDKPVVIDSSTGWSFAFRGIVPLWYSFPYAKFPSGSFLYPTLIWMQIKNLTSVSSKIEYSKAVNMLWYGWSNYYHFFTDVIPTLLFISKIGLKDVVILIPKNASQKSFVNEFFGMFPVLKELKIDSIPSGTQVKINSKVFFSKASRYQYPIKYLNDSPFREVLSLIGSRAVKRIFLYRPYGTRRYLANTSELSEFLKLKGFECYDTSKMPLKEQIALFKSVEICVGVHGAGLTNLAFSDQTYTLIEIVPESKYTPLHYEHQTKILGGSYFRICGKYTQKSDVFAVELDELKDLIESLGI